MTSTLAWLDHDPTERERMTRILALFSEKESRDELGLGAIRDSLAETLFPGTSTIQTRLRYMLFIPWIYQKLEESGVSATEVARRARKAQTELITPLLGQGEDGGREEGVLGRLARGDLKRLPSAVYWAGLGSWGIRLYGGNQEQYHRAFDQLRERRKNSRRRDDLDIHDDPVVTWHPDLPGAPEGFPRDVSFALRRDESIFIRDRILERHGDSLLAWFARDPAVNVDADQVWEHPHLSTFTPVHQELVHHCSVFSEAMFGAALVYNLQLAELRQDEELTADYANALNEWVNDLDEKGWLVKTREWDLVRFWQLVCTPGHTVTEFARRFAEGWVAFTRTGTLNAVTGREARGLVRERERFLKKAHSRFANQRALDQWGGQAGVFRGNYRWPAASRLLSDLKAPLNSAEAE